MNGRDKSIRATAEDLVPPVSLRDSIRLAHGHPPRRVMSGRSVFGPAQHQAQQTSTAPPSDFTGSQKNKKHNDIFFSHCRTHATVTGASTAPPPTTGLPQHGGLLRSRPSRPDAARPLLLTAAARPSRATRCRPSRSPIPRRSLPPIACAAHPDKPSPMLLAMLVVVVLARHQLRPQRLESSVPGLPHVTSACFKCFRCFVGMFQVFHADVAKVDRDVAYVAMIVHVCCNCLFFQMYVASVFI